MSFALIFSGQGAQHPRMLRWLSEGDPLLGTTASALGVVDWRTSLEDPGWARENAHAQICLTGVALAAWGQLRAALPAPAAIAGYSVGELAAFAAAGVFEPATAVELAAARAAAMDRCAAVCPGGLVAVSGLREDEVLRLCADRGAELAIRNAPTACVIGATRDRLEAIVPLLVAMGARCTRLDVALASHTGSMQAASREFAHRLARETLAVPRVPLFSCVADRIASGSEAAHALAAQLSSTLQWSDCLDSLHARRVSCVLELGPGSGLAAIWNQRFPDVPARSADEFEHRDAIVRWVERFG